MTILLLNITFMGSYIPYTIEHILSNCWDLFRYHAFFEISQNIGSTTVVYQCYYENIEKNFYFKRYIGEFWCKLSKLSRKCRFQVKQWISSFCNGTCSDAFWASKISKLLEKAMKSQIFWTTHVHVYMY